MKKVIVGLSGGVDSAVSCLLLKQAGYDVEAIFMQNWDSYVNHEASVAKTDKCEYQYDYDDALKVANAIGVKLHKVDFIKEYWDDVFENFVQEYKKGRTPNPDILCNQYIKFGAFLDYTLKNFKCDYIAMGHYAQVKHEKDISYLLKAKDDNKDQTYFLCNLVQDQLKWALFPIGHLTKPEVRQIAKENNLPVWDKKDSTGICFIGKRNFDNFLSNYIQKTKGPFIDIVTNKKVGEHDGISFYTIGQNNNLKLGGMKSKYYVCKKDVKNNVVYIVDEEHKLQYLTSYECKCNTFNWITKPTNIKNLQVRFRHRQALIDCSATINDDQSVTICYPKGALSVTEGQSAVLYEENVCLGGGVIDKILKGENHE